MAYSFDRDETVGEGMARNAASQYETALAALDDPNDLGLVETVHDVRKRCKKLRALARLARASIDNYSDTNRAFRDAARELSGIRDSQVLIEVFDDLVSAAPAGVELPDLCASRAALVSAHDRVTDELHTDRSALLRARALLAQGWDEVQRWDLDDDFDALAGGLAKTYGRAAVAFERCLEAPATAELHEWRKRVKYHWYHVRMFTDAAPDILEPWADRLHDLADALGDDHDLAVFVDALDPEVHGGDDAVDALRVLAEGRRADLQRAAFALGARLTNEDPDAVVDRVRTCWEAWHTHGDVPDAVSLQDLADAADAAGAAAAGP